MKTNDDKLVLEKGDIICCKGISAEIETISFQEYYVGYGFITEFRDTKGIYRSWKQEIDGGNVIPKKQNVDKN